MSEKQPVFHVWLKQGDKPITHAWETKDEVEAEKVARTLNEGLQPKAKALGFHYVVKVEG